MASNFQKVGEFIEKFDANHEPSLWFDLITEEYEELKAAFEAGDEIEMADACADLEYVIHGFSHSKHFPSEEIFDEVHDSNLTKLGLDGKPIKREDGKILKGPNFRAPRIKEILSRG